VLNSLLALKMLSALHSRSGSNPTIIDLLVSITAVATATISDPGTAYYIWSASETPGAAATTKSTAIGLSQTMVIVAGGNEGPLLNYPVSNGTYYLHMVLQKASGEYSNVAVSNAIVISAYGYTWVYNGPSPYNAPTASFKVTPSAFTANRLTFATAVMFKGWANGNLLIKGVQGSRIFIDNTTKKLRIVWGDYYGVTSFDYTSNETFALDTAYDIYVALDFTGGGSISAYSNGVALTLTGTTSLTATLEYKSSDDYWFGSDTGIGYSANIRQAYVWADFRSTANLGPSSFYSGGPLDLSGLAQPTIWRGHLMTANAESGDSGHGWNDAYNKGSATSITINTATYED
jgi:hypothetical protein